MVKVVTQSISIYQDDLAIVEDVMKHNGSTFSAALRFIIREFARCSNGNHKDAPERKVTARKSKRQ